MAAGSTYDSIATTTLSSANNTITFSSIPSTYTDLRLVLVAQGTTGGSPIYITYNSTVGGTAYSQTDLYGTGAAAGAQTLTSGSQIQVGNVSGLSNTVPNMYTVDVFSYAGSAFKTCLAITSEDKNGSGAVAGTMGLWQSTAAINSIKLVYQGTSFAAGTTAALYGITNA